MMDVTEVFGVMGWSHIIAFEIGSVEVNVLCVRIFCVLLW